MVSTWPNMHTRNAKHVANTLTLAMTRCRWWCSLRMKITFNLCHFCIKFAIFLLLQRISDRIRAVYYVSTGDYAIQLCAGERLWTFIFRSRQVTTRFFFFFFEKQDLENCSCIATMTIGHNTHWIDTLIQFLIAYEFFFLLLLHSYSRTMQASRNHIRTIPTIALTLLAFQPFMRSRLKPTHPRPDCLLCT